MRALARSHDVLLVLLAPALLAACARTEGPSKHTIQAEGAVAPQPEVVTPQLAAPPTPPPIQYDVVDAWTVPAGGYGRVIVVDPQHRSEEGLLAVARQVARDTSQDKFAVAFIYDDPQAARLREQLDSGRLSKRQLSDHALHFIGIYTRNGLTGGESIVIGLQGVPNGPTKDIRL